MSLLTQTLAALMGIVLLVAAFGKLDAWRAWRKKTRAWFGSRVAATLARRLLPISEVVVAILCFVRPSVGLVAAAALLSLFAGGSAYLTVRHAGEDCGCFGALMPSRIGWALVVRNGAAAATAGGAAALALRHHVAAVDWRELMVTAFVGVLVLTSTEFNQMIKSKGGLA